MKSNRIRLCAGLLAVMMAFTGCSNPKGGAGKSEPVDPVNVTDTHYLTNSLHKVQVTESDRSFVVDGLSDYRIIAGDDKKTQEAAEYLVKYIEKATGCILDYATLEEYTADGKYIVMNVPELFTTANLVMPEEDLGVMGYYIKSVGDNVFLTSNYEQGIRFAMLAFLREVVGLKMYALDAITFEKDGTTLPDMDIVESPDIPYFYRMHNMGDESEESYMMGFITDGFIAIDGNRWHNSLSYLPMETYQAEHPGWYSTEGNDLCYTAHGNEAEQDKMTTIIAERMLKEAEANPEALFVTCTIMDVGTFCKCDSCTASAEKYNGANSAAVIKFTNQINAKVQAELQKLAEANGVKKRQLTVLFFAYNAVTQPPVVKHEDGSYTPIDESVVCDENVAVFYAPIQAEFNHSFYEEENQNYNDMVKGWTACADEMFCWLYETNFHYYMYPYSSWDSMLETYRFCVDSGVPFIMGQDQHNTGSSSAFTDFKDYINSCAIFNLNVEYSDIKHDYFTGYYMDAAEPMEQYFDELRAWMKYLEETYPAEVNGDIYLEVAQAKFWPQKLLEHWLKLIDEAYEAAEVYKEQTFLYETLIKRIKKESMFLRFALIEHYSGTYSAEVLKEMMLAFKEDAQKLNFIRTSEVDGEMISVYEKWGIK